MQESKIAYRLKGKAILPQRRTDTEKFKFLNKAIPRGLGVEKRFNEWCFKQFSAVKNFQYYNFPKEADHGNCAGPVEC
jgi:hypothetical protein